MKTSEELGVAVREYRQTMGFTQAQFGELAGISARSVSTIEQGRGNPKLSTLARIEAVLEVVIQEVRAEDGRVAAWYVRDAWVDPELFIQVLRPQHSHAFAILLHTSTVKHQYMRLMPNKGQPYLLADSLERGWWKATIIEAAMVTNRIIAQKRAYLHDLLMHLPYS
jgi:transcriptional regulator with XRE-family HTH domain